MKKVLGVLLVFLVGCSTDNDPQEIIDKAIEVHGSKNFEKAIVSFKFRDKQYSTENYNGETTYTREFDDKSYHIKDILYNSTELTRFINDSIVDVPAEWAQKYVESVNSVLYFFQLPYGLNAPAVRKEYLGECYIFKKPYHKIKVTFTPEGGGVDHEDEFIYWIHRDDFTLDFLAYSYATDGGGTRFRQAINRRKNSGILVQDYVNMQAKSHTMPLEKHDEYFEKGELKELSRIINEEVKVVY